MKIMSKSVMLLSMALFLFSALAKAADVGIAALESQIDDLLGYVDAENDKMEAGDLSNIQKIYENLANAQELILQTPVDSGTGKANRYYLGGQYKNLAEHYSNMDNFGKAKDILASTDSKLQWKKLALSDKDLQQLDFDQALQDMQEREKKTKAPAPGKPDASANTQKLIKSFQQAVSGLTQNSELARMYLDDILSIKDIEKNLSQGLSEDLFLYWVQLADLYAEEANVVQAKKTLQEGLARLETFNNLSSDRKDIFRDGFKDTLAKLGGSAVPGGAGDSLERQQRQKARDLMEDAQKMQAAAGSVIIDAEFNPINKKYDEVIGLFGDDIWREVGFDFLVDAYTAKIDLYKKSKKFIEMLFFEIPARTIQLAVGKIDPKNVSRYNLDGYSAEKQFERYQALPGQLSEAVKEARIELAKTFDVIAKKFNTDDISALAMAINEFNGFAETVGVGRLGSAIQNSAESYLQANFKVIDSYLAAKNLERLQIFDWDTLYAIAGADAQKEISKRYSAFKTLEQTPKTPESGTPGGDNSALRDALQNLANALNGVQGNL